MISKVSRTKFVAFARVPYRGGGPYRGRGGGIRAKVSTY